MAGKNARLGDNRPDTGDASADDAATIAALIDGDDSDAGAGAGDGSGRDDKDDAGRSEIDSGVGAESGATGNRPPGDNRRDAGAGAGAGSRNRSRTARRGSDSAAREGAEHVRETVSRNVRPPKKAKGIVEEGVINLPDSSRELIGDFYSVLFWIAGQVTQVPEWGLADDEADLLGERTEKFVASLGKRRATNLMKSLGKIGPALGFGGAIAMVTVPRVKLTMHRAKANAESIPARATSEGGSGPLDAAPTGDQSAPNGSNGNGTGLRERSFTAGDFREIVPGYVGENAGRDID